MYLPTRKQQQQQQIKTQNSLYHIIINTSIILRKIQKQNVRLSGLYIGDEIINSLDKS